MFKNVTLEISLKPFKQTDKAFIRKVCAGVFEQWRPLLKNREVISIMMWVGDGSEILDYAGDLNAPFEWCQFMGTANLPYQDQDTPLETSLHERKVDYIKNPTKMTYGILKTIISCFKEEGNKAFPDATIRVGETFDIGPEFAVSDFKYNRHKECLGASAVDRLGFVDATATLNADNFHYAAYPNGIPQGTPFGTFLGMQSNCFLKDMGFDYLWLSNGLGFSADPWKKTGKIFDGETYYPEKLQATKEKVFAFWKLFRDACDIPLETRGTNNSVGIDYASDGVPLYDIYNADLNITAPPNSPWAALNDDFGLEIMGHMTRICELPNESFPFRYYLHDPWWVNSPWYDRYDGMPYDIYLPMAISRITKEGTIETANKFNILSIDNSYGDMPDCCVNEPLPHILKAEKDAPDSIAPLVWVYPMREFTTAEDENLLKEMNEGDRFLSAAINNGFPLCCVTSTDSFLNHDTDLYKNSTLITPVPLNSAVAEKLAEFGNKGIGVILYGTAQKLEAVSNFKNLIKVDVSDAPSALQQAWGTFGHSIKFNQKPSSPKPPAMTISKSDNAWIFSAYNPDTTTETCFKFPLGAPILCGMETEIKDGFSTYRFSRSEHRECRVYVEQKDGVISCREAPPVNARFRRSISIGGLKEATVRLFSEKDCDAMVCLNDANATPIFDTRFKLVEDAKYGKYLLGEQITGNIYFRIEHKKRGM